MAERPQKLGATALSGYFRQGLAELRAAAPYADSPHAAATNYAMPGMATPGEVTEARREDPAVDEESILAARLPDAGGSREPERDDPEPDRG